MAIPFFLLVLFLSFIYFEPSLFFPVLMEFRVAFVVSILTLVAVLLSGKKPVKAIQNWLFILLLMMAILSSILSPLPYSENSQLQLSHLYKAIALFFLVSMIIESKEYLRRFYYITLVYGFVVSLTTLLTVRAGIPSLKGGDLYRMVNYFGGLGDDPNEFGAFMLALSPLPIVMLEGEKSFAKKILFSIMAISFILCITRTRSRGAFIGLLFVFILMIWENRKRFGMLVFFTFIIAYAYFNTHHGYWERIATLQSQEYIMEDNSSRDRLLQIQYATRLMGGYPLSGVGIGNYVQAKIQLLGLDPELKNTRHVAHNAFLGLGAEVGIFGLVIFIFILVTSIRNSYFSEKFLKNREDDFILYKMSKGIRLGLIGFSIGMFFLSEQYNPIFYQWIAFIVAIKNLPEKRNGRSPEPIKIFNSRKVSIRL